MPGSGERRLIAMLRGHRMKRVLKRVLDETEFLSPHGVRALSRYHAEHPYVLEQLADALHGRVPAGGVADLAFGGNSNWRRPIWFPVNYLIVESLHEFRTLRRRFCGRVPTTNSGHYLALNEIAIELATIA
ncbi:MAG: hypothetical protein U0841_18860 [Chloroflexia bacterium]